MYYKTDGCGDIEKLNELSDLLNNLDASDSIVVASSLWASWVIDDRINLMQKPNSLRNKWFKFKTSGRLPIRLAEFTIVSWVFQCL